MLKQSHYENRTVARRRNQYVTTKSIKKITRRLAIEMTTGTIKTLSKILAISNVFKLENMKQCRGNELKELKFEIPSFDDTNVCNHGNSRV